MSIVRSQQWWVAALTLGAVLALTRPADAGELFRIEVQSISPVVYETPEAITTEVNAAAVEAGLPVKLRETSFLVPGISYRLEAPRFIDPPADALPVPRLHEVELSLTGLHRLGERWSVMARLNGGLAGDLHAVDAGVVRLGGLVLGTRHISEDLDVGLGAGLTYAFGQLLPVPVLRVRWEPVETISVEALLPAYATFLWQPFDRGHFGAFAELVGNEYAIRIDEVHNDGACAESTFNASECRDHLAYTDGNVGALAGVRLKGDLWLDLRVGVSVYRRFELLNVSDEPVTDGDQFLDPAAVGKLRLAWVY